MKILHLEDNAHDVELVRELVLGEWPDCRITVVDRREAFLEHLLARTHDIILSDFKLPGFSGLEALHLARAHSPEIPFVFVSGTIGEDRAIEAVQSGAADYVLKDRMKRLPNVIQRTLNETAERRARRLAEARVREQADFINKARDAIIVSDLEDRITFWNHGAERLTGWTAAEAMGRRLDDVFGPESRPQLTVARNALVEASEWRGEFQIRTKEGQPRIVETSLTAILNDAGQPSAHLGISTDITERKKLQEQFFRAQRLESIGMLAAGIAHDLNNVLTPILMAGPMLRVRATDPMDKRLLQTLEHSAERGAALVRQILAFAHGTSGDSKLLQIKHVARDIIEVIEGTFPKFIKLEQNLPSDTWPIRANPVQIHQILLNLSVNARDAMPQGGTLRLRAGNRRIDAGEAMKIPGARPGAFVLIEVEDSGTGIPPEVLKHIWEPFFTTKQEGRGTGLGLPTVRGIVESHQGFIELRTEPGRGTTFRVFLPAAETDGATGPETTPPFLPRGEGELLLLVDDEANNRDVTHAMLARYGYRVLVASNGTEAVALFIPRADEIRLVITDLNMPNLDGASLARILQRIKPGLCILAISGLSSQSGSEADRPENFADGFLAKPFKSETLLLKVHEMLHLKPPA